MTRWQNAQGRDRTRGWGQEPAPRRWTTRLGLLALALTSSLTGACTASREAAKSPGESEIELREIELSATLDRDVTIKHVEATRTVSPIKLTATDGTELPLNRLVARADLDQPLAFTELEMEFLNPEARSLDAWLSIELPPGARVTRFSIYEDGAFRDGEVVARNRSAFQRLVGEPREPALLREQEGDKLRARVFPVAANRPTRLLVSFVQELPGTGRAYRLPLAGIDSTLDSLIVLIHGKGLSFPGAKGTIKRRPGEDVYERRAENVRPKEDVVLEFRGSREIGLRHENMVVARLAPVPHDHNASFSGMTVLFDTSASQARDYGRHVDRLGELVRALARRSPDDFGLRVIAFDQEVTQLYRGSIEGFGKKELNKLQKRRPLGASNLAWALRHVTNSAGLGHDRVLVMSDGVITAGPMQLPALREEVRRLGDVGVRRLDVVTRSDLTSGRVLSVLTRSDALEENGLVLRPDSSSERLAVKLARHVVDDIRVTIPGSSWVYPERLDPIQAGDDVVVYADVPERGDIDVVLASASHRDHKAQKINLHLRDATRPLLETAWAGARAKHLIAEYAACRPGGDKICDTWRRRIEEWSTRHRILNEFTAMVMMAPDADVERFGIDPHEPRDVLSFGSTGAEYRDRVASDLVTAVAASDGPRWKARSHVLTPEYRLRPEPWDEEVELAPLQAGADGSGASESESGDSSVAERPWRPDAERGRVEGGGSVRDVVGSALGPRSKKRRGKTPPRSKPTRSFGRVPRPDDAYDGRLLMIMSYLHGWQDHDQAERIAEDWRQHEPGSALAVVALGEAYEANKRPRSAARAYGSLIDLYPGRADMRRYAAERIERLAAAEPRYRWIVLDSYQRALEQDPEDPTSYRLLAWALTRDGAFQEAFDTLVDGIAWARADRRGAEDVVRILREDLGLVGAAWLARQPGDRAHILRSLEVQQVALPQEPSLRFVLTWETEASDVDLHVRDGKGARADHRRPTLASGGELYQDVQEGHGLEAFVIDGEPQAYPYEVQVEYYTTGTLGFGMGKLEVIRHDGKGGLSFDQRPFVVSRDHAFLDLGSVSDPAATRREG